MNFECKRWNIQKMEPKGGTIKTLIEWSNVVHTQVVFDSEIRE